MASGYEGVGHSLIDARTAVEFRPPPPLALLVAVALTGLLLAWSRSTFAIVPGAVGLAWLTWTDTTARRLARPVLAATAAATWLALVVQGAAAGVPQRLLGPLLASGAVAFCFGVLWLTAPSALAFGDVILATVAVAVPASISASTVVWMFVVAFIVGGLVVVARRLGRRGGPGSSVPFAGCLLFGWVVAVVVA